MHLEISRSAPEEKRPKPTQDAQQLMILWHFKCQMPAASRLKCENAENASDDKELFAIYGDDSQPRFNWLYGAISWAE